MIKNTIKLIFALVLIVITNTNSLAQSCIHPDRNAWTWPGHNNWFLPTSGDKSYILNQKSGSVSLVQQTDYAIAPWANKIRGYQGVAAASNDKGKLVFFCNGRKAWKADGTLITDKILAGNECGSQEDKTSAVHGTMIVRHPLQPNKYYIITIDDIVNQGSPTVNNQKGSCGNGITFAVIDSSAKLVHASVPIERDITSQKIGAFRTTEDFAATFHANGVDIWITFHPIWQKHLVSYLLTCDGFVSPPVISGQGLIPYTGIAEAIGGVDFSYDGSKIAVGVEINLSGPDVDSYGGQGTVNLYDFNNKTAAVTNRKAIYHNKNGTQNLYNLFFSADAKEIHFGGTGGSGKYNISSNNEATILAAGKLISAPFAGNDGFNGAAMSSSGVIEHRPTTYAKSPLTSGATAVYSSNNMYIPPLEEPDIQEAAARCDTFPNFDIHTYWLCSGKSAEDTLFNRHDYFLLDSNDVKSGKTSPKIDANSATIIGQKTGIFSPKKAGPGTHRIVFVYCGVNDTMDIKITKCSSCEVDLKDTKPQICVGQSVKLDSLIVDNNGVGKWTIDSVPSGAGVSATLSEGSADTLFQALSATTKAGTYKLMYTNTYTGSTCEDSIYIVVNPSPVVTVKDTAICFGQPAATFKATSATAISWVWSDKGTGILQTTKGTAAGKYTVIVKDAKGCADTATGILTINTLPTVTVKDTAICFGQPAATFKATSATATTWVWSEKGTGTNQTTPGSVAGNYTVIAKDAKGCADTATGILTINTLPTVTVKDTAICFGQPAATFKATSATAITWIWSEKGTGTNQTTPGSVAGNYTVIAKDAKGCADTATGILTINTLPTVTVKDTAICFGQPAATFKATSATATTWVWSEKGTGTNQTTPGSAAGNYTVIAKDSKGCADTATGKLTINKLPVIKVDTLQMCEGAAALNLTYKSDSSITSQVWSDKGTGSLVTTSATVGGNYIVSVTDLHNCKSSGTGLLTVNTKPVVSLNGATICPGSTQTLDPTITKGTSPFKYSWDSGETVKSITKGAGDFTVTVTDSKNCVASKKATVIESGDLTVLIDGPIILCQGEDSVLLSNYRAIDGYSFKWLKESVATGETTESIVASTSGTYQVDVNKGTCKGSGQVVVTVNALPIVTVANQSMCDGDADKTFTAVSTTATKWEWKDKGTGLLSTTKGKTAGDYTVIVSDVNGCKDTATATLTVNALPTLTLANNVVCEGTGGATFTAVSATAISYLWSGKGSGTASTFLGTTAGSYTVEVKNVNNCLAKATATLVVKKNPVVTLQGAALCEGATATTLTAESDSTIASTIWGGDGSGTGTTYNTSKEGTYTVDITDKNGCKASASAKVLVEALPPTVTETASICAGASAVIAGAAIPGGGNYKYLWSTGETTVSVSSATQKVLTRTATSVPGGCSSVSKYTIAVNENPLLKVLDQEECEKDVLTLSDSETTINCVYLWTPGNLTGSSIKPLTNQTYTVVKTDTSINCSSTATATAKFIPIPNVNITADTISICAGETAYATAVHDARSLLWDTQETSNQASFTSEGSYIVTATNGNCPATDQVYVKVIQYPVSALDKAIQNELVCFESLDTVLILSAGLEREYQYLWNTGATLPTINPTQEGIYSVVITSQYKDTTSCSITDEVRISEYCPWTLFVPNAFTPDKSGNGLNDVFYAYGTNILEFEMRIFDRWGLMISRTTDMNTGWDGTYKENGTLVQNDVYVWKISFKVENQTGRIVSHDRIGTVTVVR